MGQDGLEHRVEALLAENLALRAALEEIYKGQGPYSQDRMRHAENTIEAMRLLAGAALAQTPAQAGERMRQTTEQLTWLLKNTDGVYGLNLDGTEMEWPEVFDKYAPALAALAEVKEG